MQRLGDGIVADAEIEVAGMMVEQDLLHHLAIEAECPPLFGGEVGSEAARQFEQLAIEAARVFGSRHLLVADLDGGVDTVAADHVADTPECERDDEEANQHLGDDVDAAFAKLVEHELFCSG